jgi:hypothetical protein
VALAHPHLDFNQEEKAMSSNRYSIAQNRYSRKPATSFTRSHPFLSTFIGMLGGTLLGLLIFLAFRDAPKISTAESHPSNMDQRSLVKPQVHKLEKT